MVSEAAEARVRVWVRVRIHGHGEVGGLGSKNVIFLELETRGGGFRTGEESEEAIRSREPLVRVLGKGLH